MALLGKSFHTQFRQVTRVTLNRRGLPAPLAKVAHVESNALCTIGDLVEDVVVWLHAPPRPGTDTPSQVHRSRGGSAANVAAFVANLGVPSRFVGRVGFDALGSDLVDRLASAGVDTRVQRVGRTGSIIVLVGPDGERTMISDRAAAVQLEHPPRSWVDGCSTVHVPMYSLVIEPLATSAGSLSEVARGRGARFSIDASSVSILEDFGVDDARALLSSKAPDVLFANADEARVLRLLEEPMPEVGLTVIKNGPHPAMWWLQDGEPQQVPAPEPVAAADSTGAGDAFAAGFLVAMERGADPGEATMQGHQLAGRVLSQPGADLE